MSEAEKTLNIKFVADLDEPRQALREFQNEVQGMTFPIGGGGASALPAGGAPNRTSDVGFSGIFDSLPSFRSRRASMPDDLADFLSQTASGELPPPRGRFASAASYFAGSPLAAAGGGGSILPPPRGTSGAEDFGGDFQSRPSWMNLQDDTAGMVSGQLVGAGWRDGRGPLLLDGPGGWTENVGAGARWQRGGWWSGNGGDGGNGGNGNGMGGGAPAGPDDDEDAAAALPAARGGGRGASGHMGFMGRFAVLEGVNATASLAYAVREGNIQRAMAMGDPDKLAMADIDERHRFADAVPFGLGKLGLLIRDPDGSDELSVTQPIAEAKAQDARGKAMFDLQMESVAMGRRADIAALPEGSRDRVIAGAEDRRKAQYETDRQNAERGEGLEVQRYQKTQADTEAEYQRRHGVLSNQSATSGHHAQDLRDLDAEFDQRRQADQREHDRQEDIIKNRHTADDANADTLYNSSLRDDSIPRRAALDTQRMSRMASMMRQFGFSDDANSYELRRKGEIAADATQDPELRGAMIVANAAAVGADAGERAKRDRLDDISTINSVELSAAEGRGDAFEAQFIKQRQANVVDLYSQQTWSGRWNASVRGLAAIEAIGQEQDRQVNNANAADERSAGVAGDLLRGDTRQSIIDNLNNEKQTMLDSFGDVNGPEYIRRAPDTRRRFAIQQEERLKQFDDSQRLSDYGSGWQATEDKDLAVGKGKSARATDIEAEAFQSAQALWQRGGPGDNDRANAAIRHGISEEQAYQRQLQWEMEGGQGHGVGGIAPGGIAGFRSTRPPNAEDPAQGNAAVVAAIKALQQALTGQH